MISDTKHSTKNIPTGWLLAHFYKCGWDRKCEHSCGIWWEFFFGVNGVVVFLRQNCLSVLLIKEHIQQASTIPNVQ